MSSFRWRGKVIRECFVRSSGCQNEKERNIKNARERERERERESDKGREKRSICEIESVHASVNIMSAMMCCSVGLQPVR
jgi:predicted amino acid dehydrogenase